MQKTLAVDLLRKHQIPFNPDYRFLVSDWSWVQPHLVDDHVYPKNARKYLDLSIFIYLNERYTSRNCKYIAYLINRSQEQFEQSD